MKISRTGQTVKQIWNRSMHMLGIGTFAIFLTYQLTTWTNAVINLCLLE